MDSKTEEKPIIFSLLTSKKKVEKEIKPLRNAT